jgi:hypothetical protein
MAGTFLKEPRRGGTGGIGGLAYLQSSSLAPSLAHGDEPLFGFAYTTDLLPKGKLEVEQRFAQAIGNFWLQETAVNWSAA